MNKKYFKRYTVGSIIKNSAIKYNPTQRFSGKDYENTEEKLNELKELYKNGVPDETIEKWIMSL